MSEMPDIDGPPTVSESDVELPEETYSEEYFDTPPEQEPGPSVWDEPTLDIPWYERALDAVFDFFYRITRR